MCPILRCSMRSLDIDGNAGYQSLINLTSNNDNDNDDNNNHNNDHNNTHNNHNHHNHNKHNHNHNHNHNDNNHMMMNLKKALDVSSKSSLVRIFPNSLASSACFISMAAFFSRSSICSLVSEPLRIQIIYML